MNELIESELCQDCMHSPNIQNQKAENAGVV